MFDVLLDALNTNDTKKLLGIDRSEQYREWLVEFSMRAILINL